MQAAGFLSRRKKIEGGGEIEVADFLGSMSREDLGFIRVLQRSAARWVDRWTHLQPGCVGLGKIGIIKSGVV